MSPRPATAERRATAIRPALALLTALAAGAGPATAQKAGWDVEDPGGPTNLLAYVATEGTWVGVDVAPDGRHLVFDLLGHLYEMPVDGGDARRLTEGRSWNLAPRYSPDGASIVFSSDRSGTYDVWLLQRSSGELANISRAGENVYRPSWSADGSRIFATGSRGLMAYDLAGKATVVVERRSGVATSEPGDTGFFFEDNTRPLYPFAFNPYEVIAGGARIAHYDAATGEVAIHVARPGGAFNPALSPDGTRLAYLNRDVEETVLVLLDLASRRERVLVRGLDPDRQEGGGFAGPYPNMAWHPDGRRIFLSYGGRIHVVDVASGQSRPVEFRAPVRREMTRTLRHTVEIPERSARTRAHRWAMRTGQGVLYEALGDLWLRNDTGVRNLTGSTAHETTPIVDAATGTLYYAAWTDDEHGGVFALAPGAAEPARLTALPAQYGSLALSPDGRRLAYVRGTGMLARGGWLSNETSFELVVQEAGSGERVVTPVRGRGLEYANFAAKVPPHVSFGADGEIYFTEFVRDTLVLSRVGLDGRNVRVLYRFPHAAEVSLSPDRRWIAFREYHRSFLTPFQENETPPVVSAYDSLGVTLRIDGEDGGYFTWSADGSTLGWTRAAGFYEKEIATIIDEDEGRGLTAAQRTATPSEWRGERIPGSTARRTDLALEFDVDVPDGDVAFTGVRVVTMNPERAVLEDATVLVRNHRIEAVGTGIAVPPGTRVFDLPGHTIIPGLVDAHAHPHIDHSALHVIEQRPPYLHAPLAYGVTTMFEVYGNEHRDGWLSDMLRAGRMTGPRLFTTGSAIFGLRTFRPRMYRPIHTLADAFEQLRWNRDHGATAVKDYGQMSRTRRHLVARAARALGLNVVSESWGDPQMNLTQLLDGVTGIEHSMGLARFYDDVVRFWGATDAGLTPTLLIGYGGMDGEGWFHQQEKLWEDEKLTRFIQPQDLMRLRRTEHMWPEDYWGRDLAAAALKLYHSGVPVQAGAHGQMLGLDMHWELAAFVDGGFTPAQALEAATIRSAAYHGVDGALGSVEPGKLADLVVLRDNPLDDIHNSRSIVYVMKHGVIYRGEDATRVHPHPRAAGIMYFRAPATWPH